MNNNKHLENAKKLHRKAIEEFQTAREKSDSVILRDACAKAWLSTLEATYALLTKKGVKEKSLPKGGDRGRRYMVFKYANKELRRLYFSLRDTLHIYGYYDGTLEFDEAEEYLNDLKSYIQKVEEMESFSPSN